MPSKKKAAAKKPEKTFEESRWNCIHQHARPRDNVIKIESYKGNIHDTYCVSGSRFMQSLKLIENHNGNAEDISVHEQEFTAVNPKRAKIAFAVRRLSANLDEVLADAIFKDQHSDLKADCIINNSSSNLKDWRTADNAMGESADIETACHERRKNKLVHDRRRRSYDTPPIDNANYAWILHVVSELSELSAYLFTLVSGEFRRTTILNLKPTT